MFILVLCRYFNDFKITASSFSVIFRTDSIVKALICHIIWKAYSKQTFKLWIFTDKTCKLFIASVWNVNLMDYFCKGCLKVAGLCFNQHSGRGKYNLYLKNAIKNRIYFQLYSYVIEYWIWVIKYRQGIYK